MNTILFILCFLIGSGYGKRDYLKECVVKFQDAISEVCKLDSRDTEPCFNDEITEQYGYNVLTTITTLSFECCDIACTSESIMRDFCCHGESCRRRCSTKNDVKIREAPLPDSESSEDSIFLKSSSPKSEESKDSSKSTVHSGHSSEKLRSKAAEFRFHRVRHRRH